MVEVRELERVAQEEDRRVVADQVPVPFLCVELHREAANVAFGVGGAALAGDRGEADEHVGLLADSREYLGLGVCRDVVGDGECAERARALGVHPSFGDHFAVEMGKLLQEPDVLEQHRAAGTGRHRVLVVWNRRASDGRQLLLVGHDLLLLVPCGCRSCTDVISQVFWAAQASQTPRTSTWDSTTLPKPLTRVGMGSALRAGLSKSRTSPQRTHT